MEHPIKRLLLLLSVEEKEDTERKEENKKQSFDGADRVTVDMMDSIDSSSQR